MDRLAFIFILTILIHTVDTFSYSVRIAGVRTKHLALALSLFNIIVLISRTSNMVQAPLLGSLVDYSIASHTQSSLEFDFRMIIFAATIGGIIGALLIPTFVKVFTIGINKLQKTGSVPSLIYNGTSLRGVRAIKKSLTKPDLKLLKRIQLSSIPKGFLIINILITAIYTIGVLSSIYAGAMIPAFRLTASQLSGLINGAATIMLAMLVDPRAAMITDEALHEVRPPRDVNTMVALLVGGKIAGTLLGQLLFMPAVSAAIFSDSSNRSHIINTFIFNIDISIKNVRRRRSDVFYADLML